MKVALEAFAKVNRSLLVLGKRPDGYHELDTIFQTIDLTDHLTFEMHDEVLLTSDDTALPVDDTNLVLKAARTLKARSGVKRGAAIQLSKKIPVGAGLGGGSSNAAAALRGLSALWGLTIPAEDLQSLAAALGSDVTFFLHGGTARGTGRGEKITPLPDPPAEAMVLLSPPFSLSTASVYGAVSAPALTGPGPSSEPRAPVAPDRNDLEPAAESLHGELRRLREALRDVGARQARLSGSGSTVFGVFESLDLARQAAARLTGSLGKTRVRVVSTVPRGEFTRRSTPARVE